MYKNTILLLVFVSFALFSCAKPSPAHFLVTPGNVDEYLSPTYTPRPIPTPFPKSKNGEIVLLLRKRFEPFEVVLLRLSNECLQINERCGQTGEILGVFPQSLSQVQEVSWTKDGHKAFFWDGSASDIYVLDGDQGVFQIFKKEVPKVRENFLFSPDGQDIIFEIQKNDHETDLVVMNSSSGNITKFDLAISGAKHPSQWVDENTVLFWNEVSEGKGYLVDIEVYTLDVNSQSIQPFDIGRDWMETTVPVFSSDRKWIGFTASGTVIVRNVAAGVENIVNVLSENFLWSPDSETLAIYSQNKELFTVKLDGSRLDEVYSLSENEFLENWTWLPDGNQILLIVSDQDGNKQIGVLSIVDKAFTPLNIELLSEYDPVSFSFRP